MTKIGALGFLSIIEALVPGAIDQATQRRPPALFETDEPQSEELKKYNERRRDAKMERRKERNLRNAARQK